MNQANTTNPASNPIPFELQYSNIKPKGWYTRFKKWPLQPNSSNVYWQNNEIVRFLFQFSNGVMDPYRSHFEVDVEVFSSDLPVGALVMDVSAQSLIAQSVVTSNAREIERIQDYDVLAAYLYDMGFSEWVCENREWEGMGFSNEQTKRMRESSPYASQVDFSLSINAAATGNNIISEMSYGNCVSPTKTVSGPNGGSGIISTNPNAVATNPFEYNQFTAFGQLPQHLSQSNPIRNYSNLTTAQVLSVTGKLGNIRYEYQPEVSLGDYIDSSSSIVTNNPLLPAGVIPTTFATGATMPSTATYSTYYPSTVSLQQVGINSGGSIAQVNAKSPNTTSVFGYSKPYSSSFSRGMNEPFLSPTIPQCQLTYGQVLQAPVPISKKTFKIPFLSTVLGVLIPVDQFLLIPLKALNNTLIELTLNPYAMFSTGCADVHELDSTGMAKQLPRKFYITNIIYNLHLYDFPQEEMTQYIQSSLTKEITITGSMWIQSSQYQIPNGSVVKNNWQINTSSESMAEIVCLFLSNEYLKYTYCRKQFRLSNNITSFQIKFNVDYYPPQPITGNAGCPEKVDNTGDNSPFLEMLLLSNNYLFSTNNPQPKINTYNFSLNKRIYDPSNNINPLYLPAILTPGNNDWTATNMVNGDVPLGQAYFHENRHRGMAAYSFSFEPYGHSKEFMTGIDTRNVRPFDVLFDTASVNQFTTDQTLYVYSRNHVIVIYGNEGISVLGR